jgi:hypothetical protein
MLWRFDDWAMVLLSQPQRRVFWKICEDRYQVRSLILTSQLPVTHWHEQIGDPTVRRRHPGQAGSQRPKSRSKADSSPWLATLIVR